jgi:hypothetical protein
MPYASSALGSLKVERQHLLEQIADSIEQVVAREQLTPGQSYRPSGNWRICWASAAPLHGRRSACSRNGVWCG